MKAWYDNPFINAAVTLIEPLPIGVMISVVSAGILRRRKPKDHEQLAGEPLPSS